MNAATPAQKRALIIITPTAHTPATLSRRAWYIGNVDDGVTAGPFRTRSDALLHFGFDKTRNDGCGHYKMLDWEGYATRYAVAKGADWTGFVGVTV